MSNEEQMCGIPPYMQRMMGDLCTLSHVIGKGPVEGGVKARTFVEPTFRAASKLADQAHDLTLDAAGDRSCGVPLAVFTLYIMEKCRAKILENELVCSVAQKMNLV